MTGQFLPGDVWFTYVSRCEQVDALPSEGRDQSSSQSRWWAWWATRGLEASKVEPIVSHWGSMPTKFVLV